MLSKIIIGVGIIMLILGIYPVLLLIINLISLLAETESAGIGAFGIPLLEILLLISGIISIVLGISISGKNKAKIMR